MLYQVNKWRIFIEKSLRKIFTHEDYLFYNILLRLRLISAKTINSHIPFIPDVIIIYWIDGTLSPNTIFQLAHLTKAKLFWYLMDEAPLTGGCHYSWNCPNYKIDCNNCPAFSNKILKTIIAKGNLKSKQMFLSKLDIQFIGANRAMESMTKQSSVFHNSRYHFLPLGINPEKFYPHPKYQVGSKRKFLIGSPKIKDKRKGFSEFISALKIAIEIDPELIEKMKIIVVGDLNEQIECSGLEVEIKGYLTENELANSYRDSDFFISPSLQDAGPFMINQAMGCCLPILSYSIGFAKDVIMTEITGYCAQQNQVADLAKGLIYLANCPTNHILEMRKNVADFRQRYLINKNNAEKLIQLLNQKLIH
ncbi:MAG: glycosyltransferase [Bacteroidetes bacterium]|nr:glycosyltransferase [Bacteroidota bacterium]